MSPSVAAVAKARAVLFICVSSLGVSRITYDDFKCTTGAVVPLGQKPAGPKARS